MFSKRLKDLRINAVMTQKDLAALLNVAITTISSWECGTKQPSFETLILLTQIFNTSADYMLGLTDLEEQYPKP